MARRRRRRNLLDYIALPSLDLDSETKKGIFIVFILAIGAVCLLSLFDLAGSLGQHFSLWLEKLFGWGKYLLPVLMLFWGYMLYDEERFEVRAKNYLGALLLILSFHSLLFVFIEHKEWASAVSLGVGGGYAGLLLANTFYQLMGPIASFLITLGLLIISIMLTFDTSLKKVVGNESLLAKLFYPVNFLLAKIFNKDKDEEDKDKEDDNEEEDEEEGKEDEEEDEDEEEEEGEEEDEEDSEDEEDEEEEKEDEEEKEEKPVQPAFVSKPVKSESQQIDMWWMEKNNIEINLPFSLLEGKKGKPTSGDIKINKERIRHTLENFGIPVEMGEISVGPTVTQYTFKPAEGIKLSRITNLSNDLALALAAHPIRIEAPIPNRSLVGVEVPNQVKAIVGLKEILQTGDFKNRKENLMIALGKDVSGRGRLDMINKMPHLLVAGATNSGKSVCLNAIIVSLMYQNNPDDLRFIMVDPKRVELTRYNGIPYLLTPVITDVNKTINALRWCLNEMDRRFELLQQSGQRDIGGYNQTHEIRMPYIVFIIDELADLMVAASREIEGGVIRLAQMARAVGIHLVLATQRPSVDIITGVIKANMPARIAFSVASGVDSRTILDTLGAEKLLGRGDMLFQNAEMSRPSRLQGAFVSDIEVKKIVRYIKERGGDPFYHQDITEKQKVRGIGGAGLNGGGEDDDDLLLEAKEIVINMGKASASLLQRKLRVGYARAASLLDALEEAGVIGPANGAKPREIMISPEQYESLARNEISGAALHRREEAEAPDEYLPEDDEEDEDEGEEGDEDGEDEDSPFTDETDEEEEDEDEEPEDEEDEEDEEKADEEEEEEEPEIKPKRKKVIKEGGVEKLFSR